MPVIPDEQIAAYAKGAGFVDSEIATMVAIALAESGGDTSALGDQTLETSEWGPSVGLWQIRSLNAEKGHGTERDQIANLDPATNAVHAKAIRDSQGLSAWSTYTSNAYALFLARGNLAAANAGSAPNGGGGVPVQTVGLTSDIKGVANFFTELLDPHMWYRIGLILGGLILVFIGVVILLRHQIAKVGGDVAKVAAVVPK